jgi:hypothetical protein
MRIVEYEVDHGGGRGPETVRCHMSHVTGIYYCRYAFAGLDISLPQETSTGRVDADAVMPSV